MDINWTTVLSASALGTVMSAVISAFAARRLERLKVELQHYSADVQRSSQEAMERLRLTLKGEAEQNALRFSRGFDRRLDWYERMIEELNQTAIAIAVAKNCEWDYHDHLKTDLSAVPDKLVRKQHEACRAEVLGSAIGAWQEVQIRHVEVNQLTAMGALYARRESFGTLWASTGFLQKLANKTNAFESPVGVDALRLASDVIPELRRAANVLAADMRSQLNLDPLGTHPRDVDNSDGAPKPEAPNEVAAGDGGTVVLPTHG